MKIQCTGCQTLFSVPEDKIPEGKVVRLLCPKCKTPIEVGPLAEPRVPAPFPDVDRAGFQNLESMADEDVGPDLVEEGVKKALTCVTTTARSEIVEVTLDQLDFYVVPARSAPFAIGKLHHNQYDLVIIEDRFTDTSRGVLLQHLQLLPMHSRRQFLLCLLSDEHPSLDRMTAFRLGVDLIVNTSDMEKLKMLLLQGLKEHSAFYRIYSDELARKGQLRP